MEVVPGGAMSRQYEPIPFRDALFPLRILWDTTPADANIRTALTWHEQLELLYFTAGTAVCECGFEQYLCHAGDIIVVNPCQTHLVSTYAGSPRYHCLMIDPRLYAADDDICGVKYIERLNRGNLRFRNGIGGNAEARRVLEALLDELRAGRTAYELAVKGLILQLLAVLIRTETQEASEPSRSYEQIRPALEIMAERFGADIRLETLARACFLSESYFCCLFRELTGKTPFEYLNDLRLTRARAMLLTTDLTITQIAASTGFGDSGYFSRRFAKLYGMTPRALRAGQRKEGNHA